MNKAKYQTILIIVVMLILGALTIVMVTDSYSLDMDKYEVTTYRVERGDTLWASQKDIVLIQMTSAYG